MAVTFSRDSITGLWMPPGTPFLKMSLKNIRAWGSPSHLLCWGVHGAYE